MITRKFIQDHPTWLFVFGDNLQRRGLGGQAAVCRGEPNVFGVATKRAPTNHEDAYLSDKANDVYRVECDLDCLDNEAHAWERVVCFPGIGEGYAELQTRAPNLLKYIKARLAKYDTVTG